MQPFSNEFTKLDMLKQRGEPNFNNLLKVLRGGNPDRYTLFEFFMSTPLYEMLTKDEHIKHDELFELRQRVYAFKNAGYDYCNIYMGRILPLSHIAGIMAKVHFL